MNGLGSDIGEFFVAIYKNFVALMSGICSVIFWALGALLEPMPLPLRWAFLAFGTIALLVACFLVWRTEYRARLSENARLKLLRMIHNGERLIANLERSTAQQDHGILGGVVNLNQWQEECERTLKTEYARVWEHFSDLAEVDPNKIEERARLFVRRMNDVVNVLTNSQLSTRPT